MIELHALDYSIIAIYFVAITALGIFKSSAKTTKGFLLAGRRLTLPGFVASLVATWYGGILGVGEFTYRFGVVNWITQGFFYYLFAAIFALFFASKIRSSDFITIPDRLSNAYGEKAATVGSLFIILMVSPAPYVLVLGLLLSVIFRWPLPFSILAGTALSTLYLLRGGFSSIIRTDILQFILMFLGFFILVPVAITNYGGIGFLAANLPETHLTPTGELGAGYIIVWGFIALWTLIDPGFYQRCAAAKNPKTARNGVLISIAFWILFDILTLTAGLYARAALPGIDPLLSYPILADNLLPTLLKGLFFTGLLATVMSTIDSFMFLSAITIAHDLMNKMQWAHKKKFSQVFMTRVGILFSAIIAIAIAWYSRSVINIWYTLGTLSIPVLLFPVILSYFKSIKLGNSPVLFSMCVSGAVASGWLVAGYLNLVDGFPSYPLGIEPMYPGLATSFLILASSKVFYSGHPEKMNEE